ncbi:translation initiation factor IF-2-like [Lemur catta]|uniref:translation initiation factor IF-2-like n=1 Tax=Lemur catta TaxID=9447 RepID=UPI001E26891E|nr:translation initiation factor IF-2-like [Lemur catta]
MSAPAPTSSPRLGLSLCWTPHLPSPLPGPGALRPFSWTRQRSTKEQEPQRSVCLHKAQRSARTLKCSLLRGDPGDPRTGICPGPKPVEGSRPPSPLPAPRKQPPCRNTGSQAPGQEAAHPPAATRGAHGEAPRIRSRDQTGGPPSEGGVQAPPGFWNFLQMKPYTTAWTLCVFGGFSRVVAACTLFVVIAV